MVDRRAMVVLIVAGLVLGAVGCRPKAGDPLNNASVETDDNGDGIPDCFSPSGWGRNAYTLSRVPDHRTGEWGARLDVTERTDGERLLAVTRDDNCSATTPEGGRFTAVAWYHSTVPVTMVAYVQRASGWALWYREWPSPPSANWAEVRVALPAVPPGVTAVSFGLAIGEPGYVVTDDYALEATDPAVPSPGQQPDCRDGYVGLTYDDGPAPTTPGLLDALAAKDARATFFLNGDQITDARVPTVKRQVAEGHVVGNHTWSHPDLTTLASDDEIRDQLDRASVRIVAAGAPDPVVFRPPYGAADARVRRIIAEKRMVEVRWDVDTFDFEGRPVDEIVRTTVEGARPGRVVLFHDRMPNTTAALPAIVDGLRHRGLCPGVVRPRGTGWAVVPG
jgi:peptidoglycan/xylan/chitin deacetylase (PgdA/CDA1 family)